MGSESQIIATGEKSAAARRAHEPQASGADASLQTALPSMVLAQQVRLDPRALTPAAILALQRSVGNAAVTLLLQSLGHALLQRTITLRGRRGETVITAAQALDRFKDQPETKPYYEQAIRTGRADDAMTAYLQQNYAAEHIAPTDYRTVVDALKQWIDPNGALGQSLAKKEDERATEKKAEEMQALERMFSPELEVQGVAVQVVNVEASFRAGLHVEEAAETYSIHAFPTSFMAQVATRCPMEQNGLWEVGFVQTVLGVSRDVDITVDDKEPWRHYYRLTAPARDGPKGFAGPWFDKPPCSSPIAGGFALANVQMTDFPGFILSLKQNQKCTRVGGTDSLKTWLVVRKNDGSQIHYLRMWHWTVDYAEGQGTKRIIEGRDAGGDAVLTGPVAKELIRKI